MNYSISVLFRLIPLAMGAICLGLGLYVLDGPPDANHFVAGHVLVSLAAICFALFTTAATIIRQLTKTYNTFWLVMLPLLGYIVGLLTICWGLDIIARGNLPPYVVAGHVVFGVGLITLCVTTVAASSSRFTLIPLNSGRPDGEPGAPGAYPASVGWLLIAVPVVCSLTGYVWALGLLARGADDPGFYVAGHVLFGLSTICTCLIALVATVVRQVRNQYRKSERGFWIWLVIVLGLADIIFGIAVLVDSPASFHVAPGLILIGIGMICFSILSKVLLLGLVWRARFALANRVPILPVMTALACLFLAAFVFEAGDLSAAYFIPARVLVGLGAVCFTLFSIVSILEAGTSGD